MSDHAKIDDVFSIPDEHDGLDEPPTNEIFTRTIDIVVTPVVTKANGHSHEHGISDVPENQVEQTNWGIENVLEDFTDQAEEKPEVATAHEQTLPQSPPHYFPNGATGSHCEEPDRTQTGEDLTDIRAALAEAKQTDPLLGQTGDEIQTIERTTYLRLASEKAAIQYSFLQNPEHRTRNLALVHRLDAALSLLEEIIASGTTLQQATRELAELDQEVLERIHSQVSRQRSIAEQTQQPLDNQTRATAQLGPLTICIGEDLRLRLLKASVLNDINCFV
jgi:hypothetical protein